MAKTTTEVTTPKAMEVKPKDMLTTAKKSMTSYFKNVMVADFSQVPVHYKLTLLQKMPKEFLKSRKIGNQNIEYIPHEIAEKALNFVFNFNVSSEVIKTTFKETTKKTAATDYNGNKTMKETKCYEASALVKFTFVTPDGQKIIRTVVGSHQQYENPAMSSQVVKQSAISKAWSVVAKSFGIASNVNTNEDDAYRNLEAQYIQDLPPAQATFDQGKSFAPAQPQSEPAQTIDLNPNY